jgi:hypothetical protein
MNTSEIIELINLTKSQEEDSYVDVDDEFYKSEKIAERLQERIKLEMDQFDDSDYKEIFSNVQHIDTNKVIVDYGGKTYLIERDIDFILSPPSVFDLTDEKYLHYGAEENWRPALTCVKWFLMVATSC